jgi:hypothetical protein
MDNGQTARWAERCSVRWTSKSLADSLMVGHMYGKLVDEQTTEHMDRQLAARRGRQAPWWQYQVR